MKKFKLLAPVEGKVIPIDQVPDPVFSQKMLGDGVAIIPKDGKMDGCSVLPREYLIRYIS